MESIPENEPPPQPPRLLLFPLRAGRAASLTPIMVGIVGAIMVVEFISFFRPLTVTQFNIIGVLSGVLGTALASTFARRGIPDGLRLTDTALELLHGRRILRRVDLTRLKEVREFEVEEGKVLLVSDKRRYITLPSFALAEASQYDDVTQHIVEAMSRIDPTGTVARGAVDTGRLSRTISEQPVRGTYFLTAIVTLASVLAVRNRDQVSNTPFPDEAVGALSSPLVLHGQTFRLFSYVFHHASFMHLAVCAVGILYIGGYLEKLLGWERVVLGFSAGVLGGAIGHILLAPPIAALGAGGGLYGLFGLLGAVALLKRRLPPTLVPHPGFWVMTVIFALLLPTTAEVAMPFPRFALGTTASEALTEAALWLASITAVDIGGAVAGLVFGAVMIIGMDVPANLHARRWIRPFAILACVALGIGLIGGLLVLKRDRAGDVELITEALTDLPHTDAAGELQKSIAYPLLATSGANALAIDVAARLAVVAAENTDRRNPGVLDTLAVARYRQQQVGEARSLINEALKLAGELKPRNHTLERLIRQHADDIEHGKPLRPDALFDR
jgi:membrane associated rhomboid family serine protease